MMISIFFFQNKGLINYVRVKAVIDILSSVQRTRLHTCGLHNFRPHKPHRSS